MTYKEFKEWYEPVYEYLEHELYFEICFANEGLIIPQNHDKELTKIVFHIQTFLGDNYCKKVYFLNKQNGKLFVNCANDELLILVIKSFWSRDIKREVVFNTEPPIDKLIS